MEPEQLDNYCEKGILGLVLVILVVTLMIAVLLVVVTVTMVAFRVVPGGVDARSRAVLLLVGIALISLVRLVFLLVRLVLLLVAVVLVLALVVLVALVVGILLRFGRSRGTRRGRDAVALRGFIAGGLA